MGLVRLAVEQQMSDKWHYLGCWTCQQHLTVSTIPSCYSMYKLHSSSVKRPSTVSHWLDSAGRLQWSGRRYVVSSAWSASGLCWALCSTFGASLTCRKLWHGTTFFCIKMLMTCSCISAYLIVTPGWHWVAVWCALDVKAWLVANWRIIAGITWMNNCYRNCKNAYVWH
jgi:hypothetical protein